SNSPTRSFARRFVGALRSRGSLAMLARAFGMSVNFHDSFWHFSAWFTLSRLIPALQAGGANGSLPRIRIRDSVGWRDRPHRSDIRMFSVIRIADLALGRPGLADPVQS